MTKVWLRKQLLLSALLILREPSAALKVLCSLLEPSQLHLAKEMCLGKENSLFLPGFFSHVGHCCLAVRRNHPISWYSLAIYKFACAPKSTVVSFIILFIAVGGPQPSMVIKVSMLPVQDEIVVELKIKLHHSFDCSMNNIVAEFNLCA